MICEFSLLAQPLSIYPLVLPRYKSIIMAHLAGDKCMEACWWREFCETVVILLFSINICKNIFFRFRISAHLSEAEIGELYMG